MAKVHKQGYTHTNGKAMMKSSGKIRNPESIEIFIKLLKTNKNPTIIDCINVGIDNKNAVKFLQTYNQSLNKFNKGEL